MTASSAARRDADDLRRVRERAGGALLRGRRGRALPALRREGDPLSLIRVPMLCVLIVDRAERWFDWSGVRRACSPHRSILDIDLADCLAEFEP